VDPVGGKAFMPGRSGAFFRKIYRVLDAKKVKISRFTPPEARRIQRGYVILQDFVEAVRKRLG